MYDKTFASKNKSKWFTPTCKKCREYAYCIQKAVLETFTDNVQLSKEYLKMWSLLRFEQKFATEAKCVNILSILNLKRIQRQGLERIYRPNGPMFKKSFEDLKFFRLRKKIQTNSCWACGDACVGETLLQLYCWCNYYHAKLLYSSKFLAFSSVSTLLIVAKVVFLIYCFF